MIDVKILTIRDLLPVAKVEYAKGVSPLSISITGQSLNEASKVYINDLESPNFVVISPNRLLAEVPESQRNTYLSKLVVIANVPSMNRKSLLHFEVGETIGGIVGIEKLVQSFCRLLLQTPGSDRFNPNQGGGLLKMVGRTVSRGDSRSLQASLVSAVARTKEQLVALQSTNRKIPSDEKLLIATAEAVGFDQLTTTLSATIALSAVSGRQAVANLTL